MPGGQSCHFEHRSFFIVAGLPGRISPGNPWFYDQPLAGKSRPKAAKVRASQCLKHRWYPGRPGIIGAIVFAERQFQRLNDISLVFALLALSPELAQHWGEGGKSLVFGHALEVMLA
ncbi:MAG: hypothetical protein ACK5HY_17130 [Parahaliea sp.]